MTVFAPWSEIMADWAPSFPPQRTFRHATRQALGAWVCVAVIVTVALGTNAPAGS